MNHRRRKNLKFYVEDIGEDNVGAKNAVNFRL
jgi:hypothetical protein